MKIKIIDLLVKIANGEEVPKKITYKDNIYYLCENMVDLHTYQTEESNARRKLSLIIDNEYLDLNDEVEIIEEPKKIEKLPYYSLEKIKKSKNKDEWYENRLELLEKRINDYHNKINELIDEINNLKEK